MNWWCNIWSKLIQTIEFHAILLISSFFASWNSKSSYRSWKPLSNLNRHDFESTQFSFRRRYWPTSRRKKTRARSFQTAIRRGRSTTTHRFSILRRKLTMNTGAGPRLRIGQSPSKIRKAFSAHRLRVPEFPNARTASPHRDVGDPVHWWNFFHDTIRLKNRERRRQCQSCE